MAISTYSELQTAAANWLDRDDLTNRITEFVSLAEATFNRVLRLRAMETTAADTTPSGSKEEPLPTNYLQMREIHLTTSPIVSLSYITPEIMFIDNPEGKAPDCIVYSKSACSGSKSSTSILITQALSCLNVPRSDAV